MVSIQRLAGCINHNSLTGPKEDSLENFVSSDLDVLSINSFLQEVEELIRFFLFWKVEVQ